jgi:hypothetical protein
MSILAGDIKLVASQIMSDVPEGGGAPTATIIADGVSNAIFPDISELDRAGGRVNMRKLHVSVQTTDTDTYMGSNIIVSEPPADPNVSVTLFGTGDSFDRRAAAASRVESYLSKGPVWGGILLENHISGQRSIQILQAVNTELPPIGHTLVMVQNEGLGNEFSQYCRTTAVNYIARIYYSPDGKSVNMWVVTCDISDALRYDFIGNVGTYNLALTAGSAKVRDTVVADAGVYAGVVPLSTAATTGAFTVNATSVYSQLVPSAQTEVPITDIRTNGLSAALVATGAAITQTLSMTFTTSTTMHVGGPIYPGSLTIVRSAITATDFGGLLKSAGVEIGQVDYDNGLVTLSSNIWGASGGSHVVSFTPAAIPDLISDQHSIRVTAETRSLSYTLVMPRPPLARTLSVSYLAQGRWYVLRDAGAGVLVGVSSAYGIGTINYTTGSLVVTLGALPDVGSSVVIQSYSDLETVAASNTMLRSSKAFFSFNSDGLESLEKGSKGFPRKAIIVNWLLDGVTKHLTDAAGLGVLSGDGTGTIDYGAGLITVSPTVIPPVGTQFILGFSDAYMASITPITPPVAATVPYVAPAPTAVTSTTVSQYQGPYKAAYTV